MLNRRLIRSKVFQAFYAFNQTENASLKQSVSYLMDSLKGVEHNFLVFLDFPLSFFEFVRVEMNPGETRYLPSEKDKLIYTRLTEISVVEELLANKQLKDYTEKPYLRWRDDHDLMRGMYKEIQQQKFFNVYLNKPKPSRVDEIAFLLGFYDHLGNSHEEFNQKMEDFEMHWEDERIPVLTAVHRMFEQIPGEGAFELPQLSRNMEEDVDFAHQLFLEAVKHREEFEKIIAANTPGWDKERIARADLILMILAITELLHFPYVPVKVTLNEYLELAKIYSTPQSSRFLNGILDKIRIQLSSEGKISKKGRGLIE